MALIAAHLNAGIILVVTVYIISLSPHLHTPFSPSLISLMVSVDVKHHVYLLTNFPSGLFVHNSFPWTTHSACCCCSGWRVSVTGYQAWDQKIVKKAEHGSQVWSAKPSRGVKNGPGRPQNGRFLPKGGKISCLAYFLHNGRQWQWIWEVYSANFKGIFEGLLPKRVWQQAINCCLCYRMPKNKYFPQTRNLLVSPKMM